MAVQFMQHTAKENRARQREELEALQAIYGVETCIVDSRFDSCKFYLPSAEDQRLELVTYLPETYPSHTPPLCELHGPHLSKDVLFWACKELEGHFKPGEIVLFTWIEWIKEQDELLSADTASAQVACHEKIERNLPSPEAGEVSDGEQQDIREKGKLEAADREKIDQKTFHGFPITERKSCFQAHLAAVTSIEEVEQVMCVLLQNAKIKKATHNIMAYRICLEGSKGFLQDSDDDGESAAGSRLLHLLQAVDAKNVVVVVSRWFGGVLLGPSRFTLINNAARTLLEERSYIQKAAAKKKRGK